MWLAENLSQDWRPMHLILRAAFSAARAGTGAGGIARRDGLRPGDLAGLFQPGAHLFSRFGWMEAGLAWGELEIGQQSVYMKHLP